MFVRIAAALAAATLTSFSVPDAVSARTRCTTTSTNYQLCTHDNGRMGSDFIKVWNPNGQLVTTMNVICTGNGGNRWEANSHVSKSTNQSLASWWCENY